MANLDFIYKRKSIRKFKNDSIPKEDILTLLDAATHAPSPKNQQNWHFIVLQNQEMSSAKILKYLIQYNGKNIILRGIKKICYILNPTKSNRAKGTYYGNRTQIFSKRTASKP